MNVRIAGAAGLSLGLCMAASAAQVDLGPMVPGVSLSRATSFSGALDDTLTFTLAAPAGQFVGSVNSAFGFSNGVAQTIQGFSAVLTGPGGYRADWAWTSANLGSFGIPFYVESLIGRADTLAAGSYSLHLTGTGLANDAYDLHMGVAAVPEPASAFMLLGGLAGLAVRHRRRA